MNNEAWDLLDEKFWKFPFCCKTGAALRSTQGLQPVYKAVGEKAVVTKSGPNSPFPLFSTGQAASCQSLFIFSGLKCGLNTTVQITIKRDCNSTQVEMLPTFSRKAKATL